MNKELNKPVEIIIKDKKKMVKGKVVRTAIYARSKVLHVKTVEKENIYLILFNNVLIYGDVIDEIAEGSFIDKAFRDGVVLEESHPLISQLIPNQTVSVPSQNKVFSQLQSHFSLQEIAYIATTLDSFFEKAFLIKVVENIYFQFRRNGKFMKAFQVLQVLTNYTPLLQTITERMSSIDFNSYHHFYDSSNLPLLYEKDPLFVELYCYKNRKNPDLRQFLETILQAGQHFVEIIVLWLENMKISPMEETLEKYTNVALNFVTMKEWIFILSQLKINPFRALPEAKRVIEEMLDEGKFEMAALSLLNFLDDLPDFYNPILNTLWETLNPEFIVEHLEQFILVLKRHADEENHEKSETQIFQLIVSLLQRYDLKTVYHKLIPLQKVLPHSVVLKKLKLMTMLLEDPNQMMELGDYYHELKQYDQAIECYSWEMELNPQDPEPVRKIYKMYNLKGMAKESADYQKVFIQLKANQESR
ncbi:MAG: hypothetical protein Q8934_06730 [Bacillota bacterium]|nr:hypothetical protein [Bacillota bacterium]